ncbi:MAG: hypothetical protein JXA33_03060 [Anaerolineae bacterium]|nr:hypothetical protein [Anaerolineae bacterium]
MQKWEHCKLRKNVVTFLGAAGVFEDKIDAHLSFQVAFSHLEDRGWELVSVVPDTEGDFVYFFKRLVPGKEMSRE